MITKVGAGGNLFGYMMGTRGMNGKKREFPAVCLRGDPKKSDQALLDRASRWVKERDKNRRKVRHHRAHLTHLISCFSEDTKTVERVLPQVIRGTEALIIAGLPKDRISFTWVLHRQTVGRTHAHCAMINAVLPDGGFYNLNLNARLLSLFDRLAGRALGLSDPMDPSRARLIEPCDHACKPENRAIIERVLNVTARKFAEGSFKTSAKFLEFVASELPFGRVALPGSLKKFGLKEFSSVMALEGPLRPVCFRGEILRPGFTAEGWERTLKRRHELMQLLGSSAGILYAEFAHLFRERCREQRASYPVADSAERASLEDLAWLNPARVPIPDGPPAADVAFGGESEYPFDSGSEYEAVEMDMPICISPQITPEMDLGRLRNDPSLAAAPSVIYPARPGCVWPRVTKRVSALKKRRKLAMSLGIAIAQRRCTVAGARLSGNPKDPPPKAQPSPKTEPPSKPVEVDL